MSAYAILNQYCQLSPPPPRAQYWLAHAIFRRKGRLRPKQKRTIAFYQLTPQTLTLPRGYYQDLRRDFPEYEWIDRRYRTTPLAFHWRGNLLSYQIPAVRQIARQESGTIIAMPGAGKTFMGLACIALWKQPALWFVPSIDLANNALRKARQLLDLPEEAFGYIGESEQRLGTHVTFVVIQGLTRHPEWIPLLKQYAGTIVVDECHHLPAETFNRLLNKFPAYYRLGLSATPDRTDGLGAMVPAVLGPAVEIPAQTLIASGRVILPKITMVPSLWRYQGPLTWDKTEKARSTDGPRNLQILTILANRFAHRRRILCLIERKSHAAILAKALRQHHIPCFTVTGVLNGDERNLRFEAGSSGGGVVIASKLAYEGIDYDRFDTLVIAAGYKSPVVIWQQLGRVMRSAPGKPQPEVWDIADLSVKSYAKHSRERYQFYQSKHCQVKIREVSIS